ncbi:MAG: glucose-1-phosphate adenylyltransferase [Chloroflexi bacterium]|nr:glucose-1-phosphate adenylyltransferase [Chloroflexota bacterium]
MNKVVAMILAGGIGNRLSILVEERAKPAVVFAGKYRIIDFTLSNCVNSGITRVGILTQYRPRSLVEHIGIGRPWELDRERGGVYILQPYVSRGSSDWYRGTADAVYQNLGFIEESQPEDVLILAGDHIYSAGYADMVAFHRFSGAQCTIGVLEVPLEDASRYGIVTLDSEGAVVDFQEKPEHPHSTLASMGIYVFNREALSDVLAGDARRRSSSHDFGRDVVPAMLGRYRVFGHRFSGYWRDVGTVDSYFQANMEFLQDPPPFALDDAEHPIRTRPSEHGPARIGPSATVWNSLICHGCVVEGEVRHSVLSPGVRVCKGARVEDAILFHDALVAPGAAVRHAILDKQVVIGEDAVIGFGSDMTPNAGEPDRLSSGITLVGKGARIPRGARIGRNCKVLPHVGESEFPPGPVPSGSTIQALRSARIYRA